MRAPFVASLVLLAACTPAAPLPPEPVRPATPVGASFGATWAATVGLFAQRNVIIQAIDRSSGLIQAAPASLEHLHGDPSLYNCGKDIFSGKPFAATRVVYNALVHGDSTASDVHVSARWIFDVTIDGRQHSVDCRSTGAWETQFETAVKTAAEAKR